MRKPAAFDFAVAFLLSSYAGLTYAQQITAPAFGEEIASLPLYVWALVVGFGAWGVVARLLLDIGRGNMTPSFTSIASVVCIGMLSSVMAYGICEFIKSKYGIRINDIMQCGIIAVCGYNHRLVLTVITRKMKDVFMKTPVGDTK